MCVLSCSVVSEFFDPMDCSLPGFSLHEDSPYKNTGVSCHALIQGVFPTRDQIQVFHMQANSLPSEPPGKPMNTGVGSLSLLQGIFLTQELNWGLLPCRGILYQLSYQGSPILSLLGPRLFFNPSIKTFISLIIYVWLLVKPACLVFVSLNTENHLRLLFTCNF